MKLYELVGRNKEKGFSPYVWRTKMAIAHKGLEAETIPLTFTEIKDAVDFAGSKTVPVLVDGDHKVKDSWDIACYLEEVYPDQPSLFGGSIGKGQAKLLNFQIVKSLLMPLFRVLVADIHDILDEDDQAYFCLTREPRIGCSIEEARNTYRPALELFQENLWPYIQCLKTQKFFSGEAPAYSDYILYGMFQWSRIVSTKNIINQDDLLFEWRTRMDQLYDGLGGKVGLIN
ncbi:MAG: glutathione S-transferase family protein [Kordiimonadaceae bacterium]|jgi:glutathione S-transferase|nr:glutathione S-transferase family protein [Kordiimonadaceae bacterium]MBT6032903.1 glutathione S-transferase family protein [Kordiimonadaceae bacterium]